MFEKATRLKLRFSTTKGLLLVEDLWDLPLTSTSGRVNLDEIARDIHRQLKSGYDVSFVLAEKKSDPVIQLRFDIVKRIIDTKLAENEVRNTQRANAEKKQKLLEILADRKDAELKNLDTSALEKAIAELG